MWNGRLASHSSKFSRNLTRCFTSFCIVYGQAPCHRFAYISGPLFHGLTASVSECGGLFAEQQRMCLGHVGYIVGHSDDRMRQTIDADVGLYAKMPVVAFLRLMHFQITFAVLALGRRWRGDQRGVDDRVFAH